MTVAIYTRAGIFYTDGDVAEASATLTRQGWLACWPAANADLDAIVFAAHVIAVVEAAPAVQPDPPARRGTATVTVLPTRQPVGAA